MKQKLSHEATRRDEIMQVAARIFATKGYHATTLEEIARELGITKPALYYHVRSKEEILREIINKILEPMEAALKVGKSSLSPKGKIEEIVKILVKFGAERQDTTLIAFEEVKTLPTRSRNAIRRREKELEETVQKIFQDGVNQGYFVIDDVKMVSFAILAASNGVYRWYRPNGYLSPTDIAERFVKLFENGYMKG